MPRDDDPKHAVGHPRGDVRVVPRAPATRPPAPKSRSRAAGEVLAVVLVIAGGLAGLRVFGLPAQPDIGGATAASTGRSGGGDASRRARLINGAPGSWSAVTWSLAEPLMAGGARGFAAHVIAWRGGWVLGGEASADETAIWSSDDGRTWNHVVSAGEAAPGMGIDVLFEGGPGVVAIAPESVEDQYVPRVVLTSADGRRWTTTARTGLDTWVYAVTRVHEGYLAFGAGSRGEPRVWESSDAVSWTVEQELTRMFEDTSGAHVVAVPDGFIASAADVSASTGARGERSPYRSWWSADGRSWQPLEVEPGEGVGRVLVGSDGIVAETASRCAGCIRHSGDFWTSTDGRSWRRLESPGRAYDVEHEVVMTDGWFVSVPMDVAQGVLVSANGIDWRSVPSRRVGELDLGYWSGPMAASREGVVVTGRRVSEEALEEGRGDSIWFGKPFTGPADRAPGVEMVYEPPGAHDMPCLGEPDHSDFVCVPPDLAERLPTDARAVPCPPGVGFSPSPTEPPQASTAPGEPSPVRSREPTEGWTELGPDLYLLHTGECVGIP